MWNPRAEHRHAAIRCRKCEGELGTPIQVEQAKYGVESTKHGAVVRQCNECRQWWLAYIQILENDSFKILLKMIDKIL